MKPPVVLLDAKQSFSSRVFGGGSESVFLHPGDHHELWSPWKRQSGSIALADRLKGEKSSRVTIHHLHLAAPQGRVYKVVYLLFC